MENKKYKIESVSGTITSPNVMLEGEFSSLYEAMECLLKQKFSFWDREAKCLYSPTGKLLAFRWIEEGVEYMGLGT